MKAIEVYRQQNEFNAWEIRIIPGFMGATTTPHNRW